MPAMNELRLNPVYYSPEHLALREAVRRFVAKEIAPYVNEWDEAGTFPRELYAKAADVGLLGPRLPGGIRRRAGPTTSTVSSGH
jgi:acyl-CoA dehydrogenase